MAPGNTRMTDKFPDDAKRAVLTDLLIVISKYWNAFDPIDSREQAIAKHAGERLYDLGGEDLMREVYYEVKAHNKYAAILNNFWDGIGEWQA